MAIYLVRRYSLDTLARVGNHLGTVSFLTVSGVGERIKARKDKDPLRQKYLEKIGRELTKSHR